MRGPTASPWGAQDPISTPTRTPMVPIWGPGGRSNAPGDASSVPVGNDVETPKVNTPDLEFRASDLNMGRPTYTPK